MSGALTGTATSFFLYDVGDAIDLNQVGGRLEATAPPRFTKPTAPEVQYQQPPVIIDGAALDASACRDFRCRIKAFDYGVLSVALTQPLPDTWPALVAAAPALHENPATAATAERLREAFVQRVGPAVSRPRATSLSEDYVVFVLTQIAS